MTGKELLDFLQGLSEEDLAKDVMLVEEFYNDVYSINEVGDVDGDIDLLISQVYE